jgi:hypothetical protein
LEAAAVKWWQKLTTAELEDQVDELLAELNSRRPARLHDFFQASLCFSKADISKQPRLECVSELLNAKLEQLGESIWPLLELEWRQHEQGS